MNWWCHNNDVIIKKIPHVFTIKFPTKRIFQIFYIWKTNRMMLFCNLFTERPSYNDKMKHMLTTLLDGICKVWGPGFAVSLLRSWLWANVARNITESLPRREPYELNSLGTTLRIKPQTNCFSCNLQFYTGKACTTCLKCSHHWWHQVWTNHGQPETQVQWLTFSIGGLLTRDNLNRFHLLRTGKIFVSFNLVSLIQAA